jgi:hypothetical protein
LSPRRRPKNSSMTRPIQNALLHQVRWSRGSAEEICVVQRKPEMNKICRIPIAQPWISSARRRNCADLVALRSEILLPRPGKPKRHGDDLRVGHIMRPRLLPLP